MARGYVPPAEGGAPRASSSAGSVGGRGGAPRSSGSLGEAPALHCAAGRRRWTNRLRRGGGGAYDAADAFLGRGDEIATRSMLASARTGAKEAPRCRRTLRRGNALVCGFDERCETKQIALTAISRAQWQSTGSKVWGMNPVRIFVFIAIMYHTNQHVLRTTLLHTRHEVR